MEITDLHIYPVKSLRGIDLNQSRLTITGLEYDRNWMITDANWQFLTQREIPAMTRVKTGIREGHLILSHQGSADILVRNNNNPGKTIKTKIWRDNCEVVDEGTDVSNWLTAVLGKYNGKDLKLVRMSPSHRRWVGKGSPLNHANSHTLFPDAYPFLITNRASLQKVNTILKSIGSQEIPMSRFRPNIVIKGITEFEEHSLKDLTNHLETYSLGLRKPCQRCKMSMIDQLTGDISDVKQPLATLASHNPIEAANGAYFGQYAVLLSGENQTISVGDKLSF